MADIKSLVTRSYDTWNAHDRDGWLACFNDDVEFKGPGGLAGHGPDAGRMFWSTWQDAFPDCQATIDVAAAEGSHAIQEAVFNGTHTQVLHTPSSGDIPPTGKSVAVPFMLDLTYRDGKFSSFHIIFDQVEMLNQLGLTLT